MNENVISLTLLINSKTPAVAILLGFFLFQNFNEDYNEGSTKNTFSTKHSTLYLKLNYIKPETDMTDDYVRKIAKLGDTNKNS